MKIFVISDLHLGGRPHEATQTSYLGSQICSAYGELTQFIDWVAEQGSSEEPVELVINGDIVDFLMEDDYTHEVVEGNLDVAHEAVPWLPDEQLVILKLEKIIERTRNGVQRGPFDAMADMLAADQRLTFILGNHDVELSLPAVRRYMEQNVLKTTTGSQFRFVYDGEAYVRGDLLIEHGNRYDEWNVVDHSALRQERSMLSRGLGPRMVEVKSAQFKPPAGSVMVTEVINPLKRRYRFIDLLKPEDKAVVPILLALHPNLEYILAAILPAFKAKSTSYISAAIPKNKGQLSAGNSDKEFNLVDSLTLALGRNDAKLFEVSGNSGSQLSLSDTWVKIKRYGSQIDRWLQDEDNLFVQDAKRTRHALLLKGLRAWRGSLALDKTQESQEYLNAIEEIAESNRFSCVVFGHTHLPKEIAITKDVTYINTGTWADIMTVPPEVLNDDSGESEAFDFFLKDLHNNNIDNYIERCLSYAEIELETVGVSEKVKSAKLCEYVPTSGSGPRL